MDAPFATVPLRKSLSDFIHDTAFEKIPANVIHHAKLCLLDLIGVGIAGGRQHAASIVQGLIPAMGGCEEVTLWGSDRRLPLLTAALMNAVQAHAIDMDDGHRYANGHPGVVTIPAAVALSEKENLTGRQLIEAIVIGYELFIRLGSAINPDLLLRGFHTTATIGCFSSGAVAAKLLKLSRPQTENALSLSAIQGAGLLEVLHSGESGKSFQVGKAAQSGVLAGLLAQQGADGPESVFEGEKGFFKAFAGKPCDIRSICKNLGKDFNLPSVYFKKHAACRHIHSALDAVADIVGKHAVAPEKIESIDIETYSIAKSLTGHIATADSELGAKFSTPIAIGLLLVFGQSDSAVYTKQYVSDPLVQSIAKKVTVHVNPERDKAYPGQRGARVTVNAGIQSYTHEVIYPRGEPENPLSDDEMASKFEKNASTLYAMDRVNRIRGIILDVENRDVREMTSMLKAPSAS
jgi:2-methylcitrate dehydratase PrpD